MRSLSLDFQIKTALTGSFSEEKSFTGSSRIENLVQRI